MAITLQLTEIPPNEEVPSRIITLTDKGGSFGTSFDCAIQLPDRTGAVAALHGLFVPVKKKMFIKALSGHPININGKPLASGRAVTLEDGTIIEIADYTMLVSEIVDDVPANSANDAVKELSKNEVEFSLDDDLEVDLKLNMASEYNQQPMNKDKQKAHFAVHGVLVDDPFEQDPFADEVISLGHKNSNSDNHGDPDISPVEVITPQEQRQNIDPDVSLNGEFQPNESTLNNKSLPETQLTTNLKVDQMMSLLGQIVNANEQQSKLYKAIDKTLTTFLEEFSPPHLEDVYSDFGTPIFMQKEKRYWRLYRKSFERRLSKGEYHRIFKALLLENMQEKND